MALITKQQECLGPKVSISGVSLDSLDMGRETAPAGSLSRRKGLCAVH